MSTSETHQNFIRNASDFFYIRILSDLFPNFVRFVNDSDIRIGYDFDENRKRKTSEFHRIRVRFWHQNCIRNFFKSYTIHVRFVPEFHQILVRFWCHIRTRFVNESFTIFIRISSESHMNLTSESYKNLERIVHEFCKNFIRIGYENFLTKILQNSFTNRIRIENSDAIRKLLLLGKRVFKKVFLRVLSLYFTFLLQKSF